MIPCVSNNTVNGAQMTLCWNIDDFNISHRGEEVASAFTIEMAEIFGPKITITRGVFMATLGRSYTLEAAQVQ